MFDLSQRRKPRRLGGGKGGETRQPREPKTLMRRLKKGLPPVAAPPPAGTAAPPPERAPERERVPMPAAVQVLHPGYPSVSADGSQPGHVFSLQPAQHQCCGQTRRLCPAATFECTVRVIAVPA